MGTIWVLLVWFAFACFCGVLIGKALSLRSGGNMQKSVKDQRLATMHSTRRRENYNPTDALYYRGHVGKRG